MVNDRNKELKACGELELKKLFTGKSKDNHIQDFLLKTFAQMLHNDSSNTNFDELTGEGKSLSCAAQF